MKETQEITFDVCLNNGKEKNSGERETFNMSIRAFDMPTEKAIEAKEMIARFVKSEVLKKLGW